VIFSLLEMSLILSTPRTPLTTAIVWTGTRTSQSSPRSILLLISVPENFTLSKSGGTPTSTPPSLKSLWASGLPV